MKASMKTIALLLCILMISSVALISCGNIFGGKGDDAQGDSADNYRDTDEFSAGESSKEPEHEADYAPDYDYDDDRYPNNKYPNNKYPSNSDKYPSKDTERDEEDIDTEDEYDTVDEYDTIESDTVDEYDTVESDTVDEIQSEEEIDPDEYTSEGLIFSLVNGTYAVIGYTGTSEKVIVPSTYEGVPVTAIGYDAFYNCGVITHVIISEGVTEIGGYAFASC